MLKNIAQPGAGLALGRGAGRRHSRDTALPLPDKPSVAVLPFDNLSGQPEETYFSDGITEDIITGLARFRSLFVVARNSSFAFRGKAIDLAEVGRKLGVSYLLEGSVRRAGDRVRITAQLIEAKTRSSSCGQNATTAASMTSSPYRTRSQRRSSRRWSGGSRKPKLAAVAVQADG